MSRDRNALEFRFARPRIIRQSSFAFALILGRLVDLDQCTARFAESKAMRE